MMFDKNPLYTIPKGVETRWASPENPRGEKGKGGMSKGGRKGSACFPLKAGEQRVLAEVQGTSGMIRRIWVTIRDRSPKMLRGLRLDFFWDGCKKPAVSAPLGDFFGVGLGRITAFQSAIFTNPEGRSFNSYIPMPFRTGMKLLITNETDIEQPLVFYDVDYTLGDAFEDDSLYFHAFFNHERPTRLQKDYEILPNISGRGRYIGANIGVIANREMYFNSWWGEGECKIYLDGDNEFPTLCGTGTEDYIGTAWGQGKYDHLYQGCPVADEEKMQYAFYRYHIPDPIYFRQDIRVTMQQIGGYGSDLKPLFREAGRTIYHADPERKPVDLSRDDDSFVIIERQDDWSSCAYFYLAQPENQLPPMECFEKRIQGLL